MLSLIINNKKPFNMNSENELIQKLMMSKKIMDLHNKTPRGNATSATINIPEVAEYNAPQASYNIPQDILSEVSQPQKPIKMNNEIPTQDRILSSKLPDEIKRLMIEHPIAAPNSMAGPTLSNDLIEKASRLMNTNAAGDTGYVKQKQTQTSYTPNFDINQIKSVVKETVEEVLRENGLLLESTTKSNEQITFKVGKHIFEGRVTKIKKVE